MGIGIGHILIIWVGRFVGSDITIQLYILFDSVQKAESNIILSRTGLLQ